MPTFKESVWEKHFPDQLATHLSAEELSEPSVPYVLPVIHSCEGSPGVKQSFNPKPSDVRLPARIASAIIPYPRSLREHITAGNETEANRFHAHHTSQLDAIRTVVKDLLKGKIIPEAPLRYDIDSAKLLCRQKYSKREELITLATGAFAQRATQHDLSIAAGTTIPFKKVPCNLSVYTSFVIMIQRLRVHIAKERNYPTFAVENLDPSLDEAQYTMWSNGVYYYRSNHPEHTYHLLSCGGHFRFYHASLGYWFCGSQTYLDYIFSIADILNNLDIIANCDEYAWAVPMFKLMTEFAEVEGHHNDQVDFMKGMEGFMLNISDYDTESAMNWKPILEAIDDLWGLDQRISACEYDKGLIIALLEQKSVYFPKRSFLCRMTATARSLTRTNCQEISALHKLIFYAEVNAEAGVKKFLKRVHTPRRIEEGAVKNITRYAKQLFLVAYHKKHKNLPKMIGPVPKRQMLELYARKSDHGQIMSLPLSWWDEIKIYDCMDNTLTTDPLEFAKDKGALKSQISYGPGDSRKELLQVIERPSYKLKDFFKSKTISPKLPKVRESYQLAAAEFHADPARLIEKEREQKWEARLFANAELENKHALSLVAARMKKALSYFDEQLMTPSDRARKALIHDAARELAAPGNYSLLLDIEGHNQSMQWSNTHELAEFLGNLFGEDGWSDLPHYFSQLTVYHYDEYEDKALISEGQLGGIEGWLNPLWTLHTTLMMKLMRIMTDVIVKRIMVYSDDVNAVLSIPQATEAVVQSVFSKVMAHCSKFGMTVKYSQTTLSRHRITMLRQHYADGIRADSTLKRLLSISAGNNPVLASDELEVAGICSSASSALELSNHNEACSYLKNYKLGLLLSRLPQMILSHPAKHSMISEQELPPALSNVLYYIKEDADYLAATSPMELHNAALNDIASYIGRSQGTMNKQLYSQVLGGVYGVGVAEERMVDNPDRVLYLQVYDPFVQDLLFLWTYLPASIGGLGASLHVNLVLSGHSVGFTKALHYLVCWIRQFASDKHYFYRYVSTCLSIDETVSRNMDETRTASTNWQNDANITPATTSIHQAIRHLVEKITVNTDVMKLFDLAKEKDALAQEFIEIFRMNFHSRVVQFYHENTAAHFVDLLLNKVETSSGLLTKVKNLTRLRSSISSRAIENIRKSTVTTRTYYFQLDDASDIVECLLDRKFAMFPKIRFINVEEVLYDDKITEVDRAGALITVRRCAPTHFRGGIKVFDDPKVGNETLYKGELIDDNRMIGHKEELLAAKLVAVTKWFLTKSGSLASLGNTVSTTDVVVACNLSLATLTKQSFKDLVNHAPTETGGEILHRIPNLRFSTATYIRSEMNRSLKYTTDLNQRLMTTSGMVDSNLNVDYLRMRLLVMSIIRDKYDQTRRLVARYGFKNLTGIRDVQFVKPNNTEHKPKGGYRCYDEGLVTMLSIPRFRYLAHAYLFEENMSEWAAMPNLGESETAERMGKQFIQDVVLRYARDLDKDYLLLGPTFLDREAWAPLISKLDSLDGKWAPIGTEDKLTAIRQILLNGLEERGRISLVNPTQKVLLEIQSQCLANLQATIPRDPALTRITERFVQLTKAGRHSQNLASRLAKYQRQLTDWEGARKELAIRLIVEYILFFHFKVAKRGNEIVMDVDCSLEEFSQTGIGSFSHMIITPDLQFHILMLGHEFVVTTGHTEHIRVRKLLEDISEDTALADIEVPINLPTIGSYTQLTGKEPIPDYIDEIEYLALPIPLSAMSDFHQILPLCKFAHKCSTTGARPETFTSPTGSDSLLAQVGLFRQLMSDGWLTPDSHVCDLTAGRGDGLFALEHVGIRATSYSRKDTFTRLNHHPGIEFRDDYDIFKGSTLKFVTAFDHVHIDVSFPGTSDANLLDVIMLLEEHNLQYSIRINSVECRGYDFEHTRDLPNYDHFLSYATNADMKPYQVYLLGRPADGSPDWTGPGLHKTMAFRAVATSFARLLSPRNYSFRLHEPAVNSVSLLLPVGRQLEAFTMSIVENSIATEQRYYLDRYLSEMGEGASIAVSLVHCSPRTVRKLDTVPRLFRTEIRDPYPGMTEEDMGNVSDNSRPYHVNHMVALLDSNTIKRTELIINCPEHILEHFRVHHPHSAVRSWCNIGVGLLKFCRAECMSGHRALEELASKVHLTGPTRQSLHQREVYTAIKLLILSASKDSYEFGVNHCKISLLRRARSSISTARILRIYRLSSYLFSYFQHLLSHGQIDIRMLNAIENELVVREAQKMKHMRPPAAPVFDAFDSEVADLIINSNIEKLFESLESYAGSLTASAVIDPGDQDFKQVIEASGMTFDIGINSIINAAIERLHLTPTGPFGTYDLGDEDILEYDEW